MTETTQALTDVEAERQRIAAAFTQFAAEQGYGHVTERVLRAVGLSTPADNTRTVEVQAHLTGTFQVRTGRSGEVTADAVARGLAEAYRQGRAIPEWTEVTDTGAPSVS
jgi:hypothetical protein